jgi:hypothetical protein
MPSTVDGQKKSLAGIGDHDLVTGKEVLTDSVHFARRSSHAARLADGSGDKQPTVDVAYQADTGGFIDEMNRGASIAS